MNKNVYLELNKPSEFESDFVITTTSTGEPLSYIFDERWDYSGIKKKAVGKKSWVSFTSIKPAYRKNIQRTLASIITSHTEKYKSSPSVNQVKRWKSGLTLISTALQNTNWASIADDRVYSTFKKNLKSTVIRNQSSISVLDTAINAMNKLNEFDLCPRVIDGTEYREWSIRIKEQFIAIPIGIYQQIISKALHTVETYHTYRSEIHKVMTQSLSIEDYELQNVDIGKNDNKSTQARIRYKSQAIEHGIPDFIIRRDGTEVNRLLLNCMITILAFSGARLGEVMSFSKSSYHEKYCDSNSPIPILKGETTKGNNGIPLFTSWQTHPIAKDALELASDITEHVRTRYKERIDIKLSKGDLTLDQYDHALREVNSAFLSAKSNMVKSTFIMSNVQRMLNKHIKELGILATEQDVEEFNRLNPSRIGQLKVGGTLPKLTPHDFRRSFAVFFKRYGFGSSATIKFQYKHSNIQMSDYYANNSRLQAMEDVLLDKDLLKLMNEEGILMGVEIFDEIYNESEHLGGVGGERIAKDKFEKLSSGDQVYMTRSEIDRLVRNGTLSVVKLPTGGYCLNATCSRVCGIGEFASEIKPCDHQVITDKQAKIILKQNKRLIKAFRDLNTGDPMMKSILIGQKQKIMRNEQMIKGFKLSFEPFNDKLKGNIEIVEA